MNQEQVLGMIRILGPVALAYVVGKGWITESQAGDVVAAVITLIAAGWSAWRNTKAKQIAKTAAMPEVKEVTLLPTPEGRALAEKAGSSPAAAVSIAVR